MKAANAEEEKKDEEFDVLDDENPESDPENIETLQRYIEAELKEIEKDEAVEKQANMATSMN